ncbi:Uncharacterised protein [Mycobacteroides abscessus subsp. abscessus]|nr:Uncharacterised protein [Mycobacteroides abscessus subsp. abscessus]
MCQAPAIAGGSCRSSAISEPTSPWLSLRNVWSCR